MDSTEVRIASDIVNPLIPQQPLGYCPLTGQLEDEDPVGNNEILLRKIF